jgi:hypothetical protein
MLPLADTAVLPGDGLTVTAAAPVGQAIGDGHPLVTVETAPGAISAHVDMLAAPAFPAGGPVMVQIGSADPAASTVTSVSAYSDGSGDTGQSGVVGAGTPGYDLTIALPDGVSAADVQGSPVIVTETTQPPLGLAVPLLAVRTDNDGTYVLKAGTSDTRVPVTVTAQANGYAILAATADLPTGVAVVLSGERL